MGIGLLLKKEGISNVRKLDTMNINKIASFISEKICKSFPELHLSQSELFIQISRLDMFIASMDDNASAKYVYGKNAIDFNEDIYKNFHDIQEKSISGNLLTTIFGGGTVVTERNFITGFDIHPTYRKATNSYVWYFKEQGYRTEAMHPIYGAFYNRASINPNLGFDNYFYYENNVFFFLIN